MSALEIAGECPACRVEGARVELYDPAEAACALGVFATARCRFCGGAWRGATSAPGSAVRPGRCPACEAVLAPDPGAHRCARCGLEARIDEVTAPAVPRTIGELEAAVARWAREACEPTAAFWEGSLLGATAESLLARLGAGERVATALDGFDEVFGGARGGGARVTLPPSPAEPEVGVYDTSACSRALASVMAADGELHPAERALFEHVLAAEGWPPLPAAELRVHRPLEIAHLVPPARRARLVERMVELASIDGVADRSELRVVRAFAAVWGIPGADVDAHLVRQRALGASWIVRAGRWLRARIWIEEAPRQ